MKITCISTANIEPARHQSASVRACALSRDLLLQEYPHTDVEIIPLLDYDLKPCRMCGQCLKTQRCARDIDFNRVFEAMISADGLIVVVPHYAPLPSKLMILTEKMEEMAFLGSCAGSNYRFPLHQKPAAVIGHGGQKPTPEVLAYYQRTLVEPVAMALESVSMRVVGAGKDHPKGVAFGIKSIDLREGSVFVDIEHDWDQIRLQIAPLVHSLAAAVVNRSTSQS